MPVISETTHRRHALPGTRFTTLATPTQGAADVRVWSVEIEPGTAPTPHRLTATEVFVVLAGRAEVTLGDRTTKAVTGDVIVVPAHTDFLLDAQGDERFRAIVCFPVAGQAVLPGGEPFTPPWGE